MWINQTKSECIHNTLAFYKCNSYSAEFSTIPSAGIINF